MNKNNLSGLDNIDKYFTDFGPYIEIERVDQADTYVYLHNYL